MAYLISELVTWRRPLSTTVVEKDKKLGKKSKIKFDKAVSPFFKKLNWSLVLLNCSQKLKFS